jgi:hypothetical protein
MMKGYREVEESSTTVANGGESSSTGPDKFTSCEEAPGLQRRSERFEKTKKNPMSIRNPTPYSLSSSP